MRHGVVLLSGDIQRRTLALMWMDVELPRFARLDDDIEVDVAVVGGGLTGITAAYLLAREGRRVALFERDRLASAETSHTTAHLTYVTDLPLHRLVERFGDAAARATWEAGVAGLDQIARLVGELRVDCDFRWTPAYLHAPVGGHANVVGLRRDAQLAASLGFDAQYVESVPGIGRPGVRFGGQACFHPRKYATALLELLVADGGAVFESSPAEPGDTRSAPLSVNGHSVHCDYRVIATHEPLMSALRDRLALWTSFVVAARMPAGTLPPALYWDTGVPYEYLRVDPAAGGQSVLFGGFDVRSDSPTDPSERYVSLRQRLLQRLPDATVVDRWSGVLAHSDDGLPFIGENERGDFVATGFGGSGCAYGAVAAMMARDACLARPNAWIELFSPDRAPSQRGLWRSVTRNLSRLTRLTTPDRPPTA